MRLISAGLFSTSTSVAAFSLRFMNSVTESLRPPAIFCPARSTSAMARMVESSSTRKLCCTSM
jgi:hypothetical protein